VKKPIKLKGTLFFGGMFDPFHNGHLYMLSLALSHTEVNQLVFIPSGQVAHKRQSNLDSSHRINMLNDVVSLELKSKFNCKIEISLVEVQQKKKCYTFETLATLSTQFQGPFFLLIGADQCLQFHTWKHPELILKQAQVIVVCRKIGDQDFLKTYLASMFPNDVDRFTVLFNQPYVMSSSLIRHSVSLGQTIHGYVPVSVNRYIERHGLYEEEEIA